MRQRLLLPLVCLVVACRPEPTNPPDDDGDETVGDPVPKDTVEKAALLLQKGDAPGADKLVSDALVEHPDDHELWFSKGVAQQALGNEPGATTAFQKTLELKPEFVPAMHALATLALSKREFDEAIDLLTKVLKLQPDFADAHYNLGVAYLETGKRTEALAAIEHAAELAPDDAEINVQLADMYIGLDRYDEAVAHAKRAVERAPQDPLARIVYGNALVKKGEFQAAIGEFEAAIAQRPGDLDARLGLARAQQRAGKLDDAAAGLKALSGDPEAGKSAVVWADWGSVLAKQGDLEGALAKLDRALELDPKFGAAHVRRIGALAGAKRCKDAKAAHAKLAKLEVDDRTKAAGATALAPCK
jgi:tetratricopeptide (TPR) repeat protein